jgi:hypothetical protein
MRWLHDWRINTVAGAATLSGVLAAALMPRGPTSSVRALALLTGALSRLNLLCPRLDG